MDDTNQCAADQRASDERNRRFQQMALPHLDAAYNLARWLCGNASDAEDVVQDAYLRAFRFFDTFRGDSMRPWLFAIVRRTWYTEWRRRASSHEVQAFEDAEPGDESAAETFEGWSRAIEDPQATLIREEDVRLVHAALEKLPVEFREVLILRELEDMSYRDIAAIADLPVGTVMSRLARGRRKLAAVLQAAGAGAGGVVDQGAQAGFPAAARDARRDSASEAPPSGPISATRAAWDRGKR
ncbi:RNA polymerase sigma factor [Trinickia terrae]|uniref:RNA polymerase sigma factor n=1 Tax=Trinickia terrae TaxID=2571161 RepID=A0A4U1I9F5_9BURK|nr:RNA polymerase sigma factor [Trinickia terrae]TKC90119.1 RNA polymerase sigma factor [Trinickia terrae]